MSNKKITETSSRTFARKQNVESFRTAAECIGTIEPGMALFAITRGQFSMIDAILACLDQIGPADISIWTWTIAEYEIQCMERLRMDQRIVNGTLLVDRSAKKRNQGFIRQWRKSFGLESVRWMNNHAKIATLSNTQFKLLLRGSFNLNHNPRFEQFDLTEGGNDFNLVKNIENEMPILNDDFTHNEVSAACQLDKAFSPEDLKIFQGYSPWKP